MNTSDDEFWMSLEDACEPNYAAEDLYSRTEDDLSITKKEVVEKIKIQQAQRQRLLAQANTADRKAHSHRLFEVGNIVEKILGRDILTSEDLVRFENFLIEQENNDRSFSNAMNSKPHIDTD